MPWPTSSASGPDVGPARVILTADDFGLAVPVNEAVERAHRDGVLGCASLMIGAPAAADAIERARRLPGLRVGLHLVLVEGRPVLPPAQIPALVRGDGRFHDRPGAAGFRFFFTPGARRQLAAEVRAQLAAFRATGLALDHLNAHNHMHLHPTVLRIVLRAARDFGVRAVRLPYEPPLRSWRAARRGLAPRVGTALFLLPWTRLLRRRLRRAGLTHNDVVFGLHDSGRLVEELVLRCLAELPAGAVSELYFHVATRRCPEIDRTMPDYRHEDELAALTSARVRRELERRGIRRVAFTDLAGG